MLKMIHKEIKPEKIICTLMFIMGLAYSFIVPVWQTPDETAHLYYIAEAIGNDDFADNIIDDIDIDASEISFRFMVQMDWNEQVKAMTKSPTYTRSEMMPHSISFSLIKHLPSYLGMLIGILLGLPAYWVMQLGELGSLLFYVFVCYHAIRIMPYKKQLFGLTLMIPMALQQATSIGYDVIVLAVSAFYIAYTFYLKYTKERIETTDILKMFGLFLLITYMKVPYAVFGLLVFLLPKEKMHLKIGKVCLDGSFFKKYKIPLMIGFIALIALGVFALRNNFWMQILIGCVLEWKRTLVLFGNTIKEYGTEIFIGTIGLFGWIDTPISPKACIIAYLMFFGLSFMKMDAETLKLRKSDYVVMWITFILLVIMTFLSMVNHSVMLIYYGSESASGTYDIREALYVITYISGIQGRYFLPYFCLPFLALPSFKKTEQRKIYALTYLFEIVLFIYVMQILLGRYWI